MPNPPLYQAKRGEKSVYLKDDPATKTYLVANVVANATLITAGKNRLTGDDLTRMVKVAQTARAAINQLARKTGYGFVIEQAAILGGLDAALLDDHSKLTERAEKIVKRLNDLADTHAGTWQFALDDKGNVRFHPCNQRGVIANCVLDADLFHAQEAYKLTSLYPDLFDVFGSGPACPEIKTVPLTISGPIDLFEKVMEQGAKGLSIQRYKGLKRT